jgi:hypothetical protein
MTEIRIVKHAHVAQPAHLITFSVYNTEAKNGTSLEAIVNAADVEGKTDKEIADIAWGQVRAKADAFMANSVGVGSLVNTEYTPPVAWP